MHQLDFRNSVAFRHPPWFLTFYSCLMPLLVFARYFSYKQCKNQYFLIDFCYVVNTSCILQANFFPANVAWFRANFALAVGPVATAIPGWQNSLVFHSVDKVTSFFLHGMPALLCHLIRWSLIDNKGIDFHNHPEAGVLEFYGLSMVIYVFWQLSYLLLTEWVFVSILSQDLNLMTSLRYLGKDKKNPMTRIVTKLARDLGLTERDQYLDPEAFLTKLVFCFSQLVYTLLTLLPMSAYYGNYELSCSWLLFVLTVGTWNGASYYIEVFSSRYNLKFAAERKDSAMSTESKAEEDSSSCNSSLSTPPPTPSPDLAAAALLESDSSQDLDRTQAMELISILRRIEKEKTA